jgi:hypothetical protein
MSSTRLATTALETVATPLDADQAFYVSSIFFACSKSLAICEVRNRELTAMSIIAD